MELAIECICRICLKEGDLHSIFTKDEDRLMIADKIMKCSNLNIEEDQQLPEQICNTCLSDLNAAYRFRNNCEHSTALLQKFKNVKMEKEMDFRKFELVKPPDTLHSAQFSYPLVEEIPSYESEEELIECAPLLSSIKNEPAEEIEIAEDHLPKEEVKIYLGPEIIQYPTLPEDTTSLDTKSENTIGNSSRTSPQLNKTEKLLWRCELCDRIFDRKNYLDSHMRRHRNEKPFSCSDCGRSFCSNTDLKRHLRTHTGQKPYECRFCSKGFADFGSRVKHERIHTGERPYACETCGKTFTCSYSVSRHFLTHTGEKAHKCDKCGKGFTQKDHLKGHLKTHLKRELKTQKKLR